MNKHAIVAATLAVWALGTPALKSQAKESETIEMHSTGHDDDAEGRARLHMRGPSDGRFDVRVKRLEDNSSYQLVVDGVHVGDVHTSTGGSGKVRFRSRTTSSSSYLGFDPRGAAIVVRGSTGDDVLAVSMSDNSSTGDIACCIPDDSGPHCEDRTPAECAAQGGTASTATSCLPNPCGNSSSTPNDSDIVCCLPDDSGPECEDRTSAECSLQGGVVVAANSCTLESPCAAIPSADSDIACCLPDNSGTECEDRTPSECTALGGVNTGEAVCGVNTCDGVTFGGGSTTTSSTSTSSSSSSTSTSTSMPGGGNPSVVVTCEKRSDRSKASVNGKDLAAGTYTARITSGNNQANAPGQAAVLGQAEFDFDSNSNDIAAGATAISVSFIQNLTVTGQVLQNGTVIAEATVACRQN
jgi:hypothetical protein